MEVHVNLSELKSFGSSVCAKLTLETITTEKLDVVLPPIIDQMGLLSARAQNIKKPLTSYEKLVKSPNQILYILWNHDSDANKSVIMGFLKCERKILYLHDTKLHCLIKRNPLCLLDFYVHDSLQRLGYGEVLYNAMLKGENVQPEMIAIDKPSESMLWFLRKNYNLTDPCWQSNNFVVYPGFFAAKDFLESKIANGTPFVNGNRPHLSLNALNQSVAEQGVAPQLPQAPFSTVVSSPTNRNVPYIERGQNNDSHIENIAGKYDQVDAVLSADQSEQSTGKHQQLPAKFSEDKHQQPAAKFSTKSADSNPSIGHLAKERKLHAMGHHKLW